MELAANGALTAARGCLATSLRRKCLLCLRHVKRRQPARQSVFSGSSVHDFPTAARRKNPSLPRLLVGFIFRGFVSFASLQRQIRENQFREEENNCLSMSFVKTTSVVFAYKFYRRSFIGLSSFNVLKKRFSLSALVHYIYCICMFLYLVIKLLKV